MFSTTKENSQPFVSSLDILQKSNTSGKQCSVGSERFTHSFIALQKEGEPPAVLSNMVSFYENQLGALKAVIEKQSETITNQKDVIHNYEQNLSLYKIKVTDLETKMIGKPYPSGTVEKVIFIDQTFGYEKLSTETQNDRIYTSENVLFPLSIISV